jgi:hypothetical protein
MMRPATRIIWLAILAGIMALAPACQKIKHLIRPPLKEGVEQESYTRHLVGYEQTVTVKAAPKDIFPFAADTSNLKFKFMEINPEDKTLFYSQGGRPALGSSSRGNLNIMGIKVPYHIIFINSDETHQWVVVDNSFNFVLQRWEIVPVEDGTRLNLKVCYEIPTEGFVGWLSQSMDLDALNLGIAQDMDLMLAGIQAHFDPGLSPEDLVSMGLRGEKYESFAQGYRVRVWVNAPARAVYQHLRNPKNLEQVFSEISVEPEYLKKLEEPFSGEVIYAPADLKLAGLETDSDLFLLEEDPDRQLALRLYVVAWNTVGMLKASTAPAGQGSELTLDIMFEVPDWASPRRLELLMVLGALPQRMQERVLLIKTRVEAEA